MKFLFKDYNDESATDIEVENIQQIHVLDDETHETADSSLEDEL